MQKYFSRKQLRLKNFDYSLNGFYFITINSKNYENIFWESPVRSGFTSDLNRKKLSILGKIIDKHWNDLKNRYNFIELDEYIIMPNHFHGILGIHDNGNNKNGFKRRFEEIKGKYEEIKGRSDVKPDRTGFAERIKSNPSLSDTICVFKSLCTNEYLEYIKLNDLKISGKIWHRSFNDRIIRTQRSLDGIREYIKQNPANWKKDKYNLIDIP